MAYGCGSTVARREQLDESRDHREQRRRSRRRPAAIRDQDGVLRGSGDATSRLLWISASTPKSVVPNEAAFLLVASADGDPRQLPARVGTGAGRISDGWRPGLRRSRQRRAYGWNTDNTAQMRDRNSAASPDQRYDTLAYMQRPANPDAVWEIAVPNGGYQSCAPWPAIRWIFRQRIRIAVEGVLTVSGTSNSATRWVEGTATVTVYGRPDDDPKRARRESNKICFVEITPQ